MRVTRAPESATQTHYGRLPAALDPTNPVDNTSIYGRFGGTSAAAPAVAGVAALYLQTDPKACPCTVSNVIKNNANTGVVTSAGTGSPPNMLRIPSSWPAPSYRSLSLNGTNAYVDVPTSSNPNGVKLDITGYITVEAWIRLNSVGAAQPIVERYSNTDGGYSLDVVSSGKLKFYTLITATNTDSVTGSTVLQPNVWYHVAGVWGGLTLRVFVNGVLDGTKSSMFAPGTGTSSLLIGRTVDGTRYFSGLIDEVRVTGTWLYNSNFTPPNRLTGTFETKGLWRFDYQNAQDCADMNNGTLMGGATFSTTVP